MGDKLQPGIVSWKKVEKKPKNKFKKIANCNYVVVLGKSLKFSLVATGGSDITDVNTIQFLNKLAKKTGKSLEDKDIIEWANRKVATQSSGLQIARFNDPVLEDGIFLLDLLAAVGGPIVDPEIVTEGDTDEDKLLNARYAISIARKLGCTIFLLPEDIVEVRSKMIMTFIAAVMMADLQK